jgi:hypothetical protein
VLFQVFANSIVGGILSMLKNDDRLSTTKDSPAIRRPERILGRALVALSDSIKKAFWGNIFKRFT